MRKLSLDSILLLALVVPFIMNYRLSPGTTPFWLFGIIFIGVIVYILLDVSRLNLKKYFLFKNITLWIVILAVIGSAIVSAIIVRHQTSPTYAIHDIILQQESAIRFLIHGKNPYATTYFGTPLEQWHYSDTEINPALYHFVMEPLYLVLAIPFYFFSNIFFGFFDGRIPLFIFFLGALLLTNIAVKDQEKKLLFMILLAFNPAMLPYTLEGRSDMFMFPFLLVALVFLSREKYLISGIAMGVAFAIKQSVWPILPLYIFYIYFKTKSAKKTALALLPFVLVFAGSTLPFLLWNAKAFFDSTIFYLSGTAQNSYPISGYGFGMLLNEFGVIKDLHAQYPFVIWQLILGIPTLVLLVKFIKKSPTVGRLTLAYGIFLFIFWYFSRYFNNSHVGYLSVVFMTAYFLP